MTTEHYDTAIFDDGNHLAAVGVPLQPVPNDASKLFVRQGGHLLQTDAGHWEALDFVRVAAPGPTVPPEHRAALVALANEGLVLVWRRYDDTFSSHPGLRLQRRGISKGYARAANVNIVSSDSGADMMISPVSFWVWAWCDAYPNLSSALEEGAAVNGMDIESFSRAFARDVTDMLRLGCLALDGALA